MRLVGFIANPVDVTNRQEGFYELGDRIDLHFFHDLVSSELDGAQSQVKFAGDVFVHFSRQQQSCDLKFSFAECGEAFLNLLYVRMFLAIAGVHFHGPPNIGDEFIFVTRFFQACWSNARPRLSTSGKLSNGLPIALSCSASMAPALPF